MTNRKQPRCPHWSHIRYENAIKNYANVALAGDPEAILKKAEKAVDKHLKEAH